MSVFKCKMCGGNIEVTEHTTIAVCDYCDTQQTIPSLKSTKKENLCNRANHLRQHLEFDKAISIFETILMEDNLDPEIYWSLVLCKYGIEYVDDAATNKKIPTCNRTSMTSIFADPDYKQAIKYADDSQKELYVKEAKEIDAIQKNILEISNKEEPFDIFICYKETDQAGRRTQDSVMAQELYYQLVQEGYKVFFSRITLEDKLGIAYEPYIFAALNSAKVMIVLGTTPEHFNTVWVKNEWSRYLAFVKNDPSKMLIPAYKDMDPYDLPEEFSHLQAQDMSKLGFMQDIIRGINKIVSKEESTTKSSEIIINNMIHLVEPLIERAFLCLEDGEFEKADEILENALNMDPKNAKAYIGKLMCELKLCEEAQLGETTVRIGEKNQFKKAIRFADEEYKALLETYAKAVNQNIEQAEKQKVYDDAMEKFQKADTIEDYRSIIRILRGLGTFNDAATQIKNCEKCIDEIKKRMEEEAAELQRQKEREAKETRQLGIKVAVFFVVAVLGCMGAMFYRDTLKPMLDHKKALKLIEEKQYEEAYKILNELDDYEDSKETIKESKYQRGNESLAKGDSKAGCKLLLEVKDYKDSRDKIKEYLKKNPKFSNEAPDILVAAASEGDIVQFGEYEQDGNTKNGKEPINWIVLSTSNSTMLISEKILEFKTYVISTQNDYEIPDDVKWKRSELRRWLNGTFYDEAFTKNEKSKISTSTINTRNKEEDNVTIVSELHFDRTSDLDFLKKGALATKYAIKNGKNVGSTKSEYAWWMATDEGKNDPKLSIMNTYNFQEQISYFNKPIEGIGIRPVIFIER